MKCRNVKDNGVSFSGTTLNRPKSTDGASFLRVIQMWGVCVRSWEMCIVGWVSCSGIGSKPSSDAGNASEPVQMYTDETNNVRKYIVEYLFVCDKCPLNGRHTKPCRSRFVILSTMLHISTAVVLCFATFSRFIIKCCVRNECDRHHSITILNLRRSRNPMRSVAAHQIHPNPKPSEKTKQQT